MNGISRTIFFSRETGNLKSVSRDPGKFSGKIYLINLLDSKNFSAKLICFCNETISFQANLTHKKPSSSLDQKEYFLF